MTHKNTLHAAKRVRRNNLQLINTLESIINKYSSLEDGGSTETVYDTHSDCWVKSNEDVQGSYFEMKNKMKNKNEGKELLTEEQLKIALDPQRIAKLAGNGDPQEMVLKFTLSQKDRLMRSKAINEDQLDPNNVNFSSQRMNALTVNSARSSLDSAWKKGESTPESAAWKERENTPESVRWSIEKNTPSTKPTDILLTPISSHGTLSSVFETPKSTFVPRKPSQQRLTLVAVRKLRTKNTLIGENAATDSDILIGNGFGTF